MSRKVSVLPSTAVTLASAVLLAISCVGLIKREKPQAPPEAQPQTRAVDDRDAGEVPTHQAPPPNYGHRIVNDESDAGTSKRKPTKLTAAQ